VESAATNNDISRRRLNRLKTVLKIMLWAEETRTINADDLHKHVEHLVTIESQACVKIFRHVKPFMPKLAQSSLVSHQLPLVLLCNDVQAACGRQKDIIRLCPQSSAGQLQSLHLDSHSIFSLFSAPDDQYDLFKADGSKIERSRDAVWDKDATFASFFDRNGIERACHSYGLQFSHVMMVRPGLKTVSLLGDCKVKKKSEKVMNSSNVENSPQQNAEQSLHQVKRLLQQDIERLTTNAKALNVQLTALTKNFNIYSQDAEIKQLKDHYRKLPNQEIHFAICQRKTQRLQQFNEVTNVRLALKADRSQLYLKRKVR
jgi:hypothetical protein